MRSSLLPLPEKSPVPWKYPVVKTFPCSVHGYAVTSGVAAAAEVDGPKQLTVAGIFGHKGVISATGARQGEHAVEAYHPLELARRVDVARRIRGHCPGVNAAPVPPRSRA